MGSRPTTEDISSLGKQRDDLVKSMAKFNIDVQKYLGIDVVDVKVCFTWVSPVLSS